MVTVNMQEPSEDSVPEDQFVLQFPRDSVEFHRFNIVFLGHLQAVYEITYPNELTLDTTHGHWDRSLYYPVGRCACLDPDPASPDDTSDAAIESIDAEDWCQEIECPVRPILREGYRSGYCPVVSERHILLNDLAVDDWFLHQRAEVGPGYSAIFVCEVQNAQRVFEDASLVLGSENILAAYLAI
ncbi:hypothetical protein BGZ58_003836, partial [Dissophora ornata]